MAQRNGPGREGGHAWRRRLACERAIALPMGIMALMAILLLASAAGTAAISAMGQSSHDRGTKRAVAAADAGLNTAIYRLNKLKPTALACVAVGAPYLVLQPVLGTGWCPPVQEDLGDGASYSYRMSAGLTLNLSGQGPMLQRKVVVTGTAQGVSRRIMATVGSLTGVSVFGGNAVTSLDPLTLPSGTSVIGNASSAGNIHVANCSRLVGDAWVGSTEQFLVNGQEDTCPGFNQDQAPQDPILNPVDATAQQGNNNTNINSGGLDPFTLRFLSTWDAGKRELHLKNGSTLTLTGTTYSFCKLRVDSLAQLIIAPRLPTQAPLKIYIDSPENCNVSDEGTMRVTGTGVLTNLNATSNTLQISAIGSSTGTDSIRFDSTVPSNVIGLIYAPLSEVSLENANAVLGSVAAERVTLQNTARIQWHPSADVTLDDLFPLFKRTSWVECTSKQMDSAPDSGC